MGLNLVWNVIEDFFENIKFNLKIGGWVGINYIYYIFYYLNGIFLKIKGDIISNYVKK